MREDSKLYTHICGLVLILSICDRGCKLKLLQVAQAHKYPSTKRSCRNISLTGLLTPHLSDAQHIEEVVILHYYQIDKGVPPCVRILQVKHIRAGPGTSV